jgi:hypothetical protein
MNFGPPKMGHPSVFPPNLSKFQKIHVQNDFIKNIYIYLYFHVILKMVWKHWFWIASDTYRGYQLIINFD